MTTKENIKLSKIAVLFGLVVLLLFGVFPIYAQENSKDKAAKDNWVLAFAEFKLDDAASLYSSYSQLLPELLSYNIGTDIGKKKNACDFEFVAKKRKSNFGIAGFGFGKG